MLMLHAMIRADSLQDVIEALETMAQQISAGDTHSELPASPGPSIWFGLQEVAPPTAPTPLQGPTPTVTVTPMQPPSPPLM